MWLNMHFIGSYRVIFGPEANPQKKKKNHINSFVWHYMGTKMPHGMNWTLISFNILLQIETDCEQNKFNIQQHSVHFHFV